MSRLFESIKLQDGEYANLFHHEQRMNRSLKALYGEHDTFDLAAFLHHLDNPKEGLYKCRIVYDDQSKEIEFIPYVPKVIRTLRPVESDTIHYEYKFADRKKLDALFQVRDGCDDVLIIKNDMVTDSSYANIIFRRREHWYTPGSPLLHGTMRQYMLEHDLVLEESICTDDIKSFDAFKLINAMVGFDGPELPIDNIIF